jgi:5-methylcytosine-specific restriction endonuclease McrA
MNNEVLLLNGDFTPVMALRLNRAVNLVLEGKAEVLAERETLFRSASFNMPTPSVIRLNYVAKIPFRTKLPVTRRHVLARDHGVCAYCNGVATTVDHVFPRSRGGRHCWENVVASCLPCNSKKDNKTLDQLGWHLDKARLFAPTRNLWLAGQPAQPDWAPYLQQAA